MAVDQNLNRGQLYLVRHAGFILFIWILLFTFLCQLQKVHCSRQSKVWPLLKLTYYINIKNNYQFYMLSKINLNLNTKNKAIQEYKAKHQHIQNLLQKANQKYENSRRQITVQCLSINQTLSKLKNKSKQFVASCRQALDDIKTGQIIDMKDLSEYLKKQKELLKNIAQQKQNKQQNKIDLHEIASKVQLQRVLAKIKRIQLQQQIKFLQSNVIVKGNFIYNPSNSLFISPTQDKENNQKLSNSLNQLQRLIQLSIPCITNTNINTKILALQSQYSRIQQCQALITEEHQKLVKFTQFIQQRKSSIDKFSINNTSINTDIQQEQPGQDNSFQELRIDENELDQLLELDQERPLIINMEHPFVSIQEKINELRIKIKKVEKIL